MTRLTLLWLTLSLTLANSVAADNVSLRGRVTDESGAVVVAAVVTLSTRGAPPRTAVSGADGVYRFDGLPAGDYMVQAAAPQLATPKPLRATLRSGVVTLDLTLQIGARTERITVGETGAPTVSTESGANAGAVVIQGKDLESLADNPEDLQADLQGLAGPAAGPSGGAIFIDGFSGGQLPPKESIREIRINQNPFAPEFDKLGYGRIEIFTKPGASKWKGTLGYNLANQIWNSRNPFAARKAPLHLQEYENSVGGPLGHRASFTLDLEHHSVDNGFIVNGIALDPVTLNPLPVDKILNSRQRRVMVSPRVDYQLTSADTISLRYSFINSSVRGAGVGGFDDVSRGYHLHNRFHTVQFSNTLVLGRAINETRFQYFHRERQTEPDQSGPAIQVFGALTSGGASVGASADMQNDFEWQNYTTMPRGAHTWRFGLRLRNGHDDSISRSNFNGTYTFTSIDTYRATLLGLGGYGPSQFSITAGIPELSAQQVDAGLFVADEWRLRPNLTFHYGLRYEVQTNVADYGNLAPRFSVAWAPGRGGRKTVLRAGFGIFYDRFPLAGILNARRFNGVMQQQYVVSAPAGFPVVPPIASPAQSRSQQVIQKVDSGLRAPYILQSAVTVERQVTKSTTLAATFTNSHGLHVLRSVVLTGASPVYLMTSSGLYNQNQLITNFNTKPLPQVSLFGYYVLNQARSNSDGLGTFPANPRDYSGEYGPASTDVRHRGLLGGSLGTRWHLNFSPYLMMQTGVPFDITTGQDLYGTTLFNSRPGFATAAGPGVIATVYGLLNPSPQPGDRIVPRNYGRGPGQITFNMRMGKTVGLGPLKEGGKPAAASAPGIDAANMTAPGGLRGLFAPPTSDRRYALTISISARNLLNHVNAGPIVGNVTSSLFGRANQIASVPNGEGFSENASNRRLELQIKLTF